MIGIDTNVLVRYLVYDDLHQAKKAAQLLENQCTRHNPGFIPHIVLCELVWVLKRAYKFPKSKIIEILWQIMGTLELQVQDPQLVRKALLQFENGNADFSDYLIGGICEENGCEVVATLDKHLKNQRPFHVL